MTKDSTSNCEYCMTCIICVRLLLLPPGLSSLRGMKNFNLLGCHFSKIGVIKDDKLLHV